MMPGKARALPLAGRLNAKRGNEQGAFEVHPFPESGCANANGNLDGLAAKIAWVLGAKRAV